MSKRKGQPTKNRSSARRAPRAATRRRWPWMLLGLAVGAGIAVSIWLTRSTSSEPSSSTTLAASDLNWQPPNPSTQNMQPQVARVLREQREHLLNNIRSSQAWGELGRLYD